MNDIDPNKKKDVICHCSGTTKEQIKEFITNGIDNLDEISRMTGACSGCGACDVSILELLAEHTTACDEQTRRIQADQDAQHYTGRQ